MDADFKLAEPRVIATTTFKSVHFKKRKCSYEKSVLDFQADNTILTPKLNFYNSSTVFLAKNTLIQK